MKQLKQILIFGAFLLTIPLTAQETVVEETVIESTEGTYNNYNKKGVNKVYNKTQHTVTGNIENSIFIIKNNATNLYGLQDVNGNLLVSPKYKSINNYNSTKDRIVASITYSKKGVINSKGAIIIPFNNSYVTLYKNQNLIVIGKNYNDKKLLDFNGKPVLEGSFESIALYDDVIKVKRNSAYGIFNKSAKEILPIIYEKIDYITDLKLFKAEKNGTSTVLNADGTALFNNKYSQIESFNYYKLKDLLVEKSNKKGVVNIDDRIILPLKFEDIKNKRNNHLYIVKQNNLWGVYDAYFNDYLIEPKYKDIHQISKTQYILESGTYKTIRDIELKVSLPIKNYNFASYYVNFFKFLKTKTDNKFGVLDITTGKLIVPEKFDKISFKSNFISASIYPEKKYTAFDFEGNIIIIEFSNTNFLTKNLYKITKNGKAGLLYNGKLIAKVEYDIVMFYKNATIILLVKNGLYSLLDYKTEQLIIKPTKDKIIVNDSGKLITHKNKTYSYTSGQLNEK